MLSLEDPQYHQGRQNNKCQHTSRSKNNYSINASMIKNQPRYISHVVQIADQHVPKQIFFSKQVEGMHFDRGPEEVMKANLKKCNINVPCWKATAMDRTCQELEQKQRHWKECQQQPQPVLLLGVSCPQCDQVFQATVGLMNHLLTHC